MAFIIINITAAFVTKIKTKSGQESDTSPIFIGLFFSFVICMFIACKLKKLVFFVPPKFYSSFTLVKYIIPKKSQKVKILANIFVL